MATLHVSITDPSGAKRRTAEVPDDVEVQRLIKAIVRRLELPEADQHGSDISYTLSFIRDGESIEINPGQTLADAGVHDNTELRLSSPALNTTGLSVSQEQLNQKDLDRIYSLLERLTAQVQGGESGTIIETIRNELQNKVEPYSIPITISDQEREPIPLVRADRLHIIEEYRDEQNTWFSITWAFIGAGLGVIINWVTAERLVISRHSVIVISVFGITAILAWLSARRFRSRAEQYKHTILYGDSKLRK
jgi:hypothetical protein